MSPSPVAYSPTAQPPAVAPVSADNIPDDLWIFGYASVIWKHAEIPHTEARPAHINGYKRRLWQGSADHRGTKLRPGRVAGIFTPADFDALAAHAADAAELPPAAPDPWTVHGMAFRVTPRFRDEVVRSLHVRETDYTAAFVPLLRTRPDGSEAVFVPRALTFVAPPANPSFQGFLPNASLAAQVATAKGDAGTNAEYVLNLHTALVAMGRPDPHIERIASLL